MIKGFCNTQRDCCYDNCYKQIYFKAFYFIERVE